MNIGLQLKIARIEKEWTQDQLRMASGVSAATIGSIEAGKGNAKLKTVQKLIECLGYDLRIVRR
jgi:DNA-binding XRE family transcriptional regulator